MTGDELLCPSCHHPRRKHGSYGCTAAGRECPCDVVPTEMPQVLGLPADAPTVVVQDREPAAPAVSVPAPAPKRPRRAGAPSYAAPGEVLLSYPAWSCLKCSGRRFEAFSCCSQAATPVTVTLTRREVAP